MRVKRLYIKKLVADKIRNRKKLTQLIALIKRDIFVKYIYIKYFQYLRQVLLIRA